MAGGVLIVAEHLEGRIAPSTLELIAAARPLARSLGDERNARIAVLGHGVRDIATHLAGYALDVLLLDHPALAEYTGDGYVQALRGTVESTKPRVILVAHTSQGYDFAPALAGTMDLSTADIIVSAGRGIQKKENLALVEEFAKAIGGVVGASRPLTDMDWLPKTRQVGQSGKTVRPKLYVACGISGAMQHVAGMKDAGLIVAINTDPTAPIFEVAHV